MSTKSINQIYREEDWSRKAFQKELTFFPEEREMAWLAIDSNSAIRNTMSVAQSAAVLPAATSTFISASSAFAGVLGVPLGLHRMYDSFHKGKAALDYSDTEGVAQNVLWGTFGATYVGISGLMGASGALGLMGKAVPVAINPAIAGLGLVMSAVLSGISIFGMAVTTQFRNQMQKIREEKGDAGVIAFLNEQVSLSPEEIKGKSNDEMAKAVQKKWNILERKIGTDCANKLRETLLAPTVDSNKAKEIILEVDKASFKTRVTHITLFVISIISIAAFIAMFLTTGPLSSILFAVGAVAWLTVDSSTLHNFIGEKCWAWHSKGKQEELAWQTAVNS